MTEEERKQYNNAKAKRFYQRNKEKIKEQRKNYLKEYREKNKDRLKLKKKQWYDENKQVTLDRVKKWQEKNKERTRQNKKNHEIKKLEKDPSYKIVKRMRVRIYHAIKEKIGSTMDLLGCSKEQLTEYLKSKFQEGMSLDNYGEWHVDHIRPCASFDLTKEEEQRQCFHYTNLQPLWAVDNLKKGSKWDNYLES